MKTLPSLVGSAAKGEKSSAAEREDQRIPVRGLALDLVSSQERDRDAERRDLGERQVDEDHAAGQHVQAEVGVDAGQHEAGEEGQREQVDHGAASSAAASRATLTSNSAR